MSSGVVYRPRRKMPSLGTVHNIMYIGSKPVPLCSRPAGTVAIETERWKTATPARRCELCQKRLDDAPKE